MDNDMKEETLFTNSFEAYVFERLEQIRTEYSATEARQKLLGEEKELYDRIKELLPCKYRPLFIRYTDILYGTMTEQHDYYYRCGLKDSVRFIKHFLEGHR